MNDKIENDRVARNIRVMRQYRNYTLEGVAKKLSISPTAYRKYETNATELKTKTVQRLADILEIRVDLLLFGEMENILEYIRVDSSGNK